MQRDSNFSVKSKHLEKNGINKVFLSLKQKLFIKKLLKSIERIKNKNDFC